MCPLFWITIFNYDSCSLIECISLLKSMINSSHAYEQNKAFTTHIVDATMNAFEEKLELEVSIPRKLHDQQEPTIELKIKNYECFALCDLGASVSTITKSLCDVLGLTDIEECSLNLHLAYSTTKNPWEELMMFLFLQIGIMCPYISLFLLLIAIRLVQLFLVERFYVLLVP